MISILNYIKEHIFETLSFIALLCFILFTAFQPDDGNSNLESLRIELQRTNDALDAGLGAIQEYKNLIEQRDREITDLRDLVLEQNQLTREHLETLRSSNTDYGDRVIERQLIIDESQRLLNSLKKDISKLEKQNKLYKTGFIITGILTLIFGGIVAFGG